MPEIQSIHTTISRCRRRILLLNTRGKNYAEVPEKLVTFLRFVRAGLKESQQDFGDPYVQKLQEFILYVKQSREMEERFMVLEEMLRDERSRGRVEGKTEAKAEYVLKVLSSYGNCLLYTSDAADE